MKAERRKKLIGVSGSRLDYEDYKIILRAVFIKNIGVLNSPDTLIVFITPKTVQKNRHSKKH